MNLPPKVNRLFVGEGFEFAAKIEFRHDYLVGRVGSGGGCCCCGGGRDGGGGGGGAVAEAGDVDVPAGDLLAVLVPDGRVAAREIHCKRTKEERLINYVKMVK